MTIKSPEPMTTVTIPKEYEELKAVFDKEHATKLPPQRL